jgi:ABC-type nitrate/sulfonate/bicarbonate transport system ATPase subunit
MSARRPPVKIVVDRVSRQFPATDPERGLALDDVSLEVHANEFVAVVGRSGCGKTTLLNLIAGFLSPTRGEVRVDGRRVEGPGPDRGMVFQHAALFPWLTALENVEFGPRNQGVPRRERRTLALELLDLVRLRGFEHKYPRELSGGMKQRVAIARALANRPAIILADEPTAALDSERARVVMALLRQVAREQGVAVLVVTHDEKIFDRFDRMVSLRDGRIEADQRTCAPA